MKRANLVNNTGGNSYFALAWHSIKHETPVGYATLCNRWIDRPDAALGKDHDGMPYPECSQCVSLEAMAS